MTCHNADLGRARCRAGCWAELWRAARARRTTWVRCTAGARRTGWPGNCGRVGWSTGCCGVSSRGTGCQPDYVCNSEREAKDQQANCPFWPVRRSSGQVSPIWL